jgi:hypothetical protein
MVPKIHHFKPENGGGGTFFFSFMMSIDAFWRRIGADKVQDIIFGLYYYFTEVSSCLNLASERCSLESHPKLKVI